MIRVITSEEGADEIIKTLLIEQMWLICCTASDSDDVNTYILENVTRYEIKGHWADIFKNPVIIEYGISPAVDGRYPYRIHDSLMQPILNESAIKDLVESMVKVFDVIMIEEDIVDRERVYGKLGSEHENDIVFINDKI